jgi:dethiobiotin synthetase
MNAPLPGLFVAGTDTGVGKSRVSAAILTLLARQGLQVAGMKPVAAGCTLIDGHRINEDAEALAAASTVSLDPALACPYRLLEAASPHVAAARESVMIDPGRIRTAATRITPQVDLLVVEGSGGWAAPISDRLTMADIAVALGMPVVLVVGLRLGCLNHAQLSAQAIRASGLPLAGWIANTIDPAMTHHDANVQWLDQALGAPRLGLVDWSPRGEADPSAGLAAVAITALALRVRAAARRP